MIVVVDMWLPNYYFLFVSTNIHAGKRWINLHRRATSRFKLSNELSTSTHNNVLTIWLFYAVVLLVCDSNNTAKDTYKHIQRLLFPTDSSKFTAALFSRSLSLENNNRINDTEIDDQLLLLKQSIRDGLSPMDAVKQQIRRLEQSGLLQSKIVRQIALPSLPGKIVPSITEREASPGEPKSDEISACPTDIASMQQHSSSDTTNEVSDADAHKKGTMSASNQRSKRSVENSSHRLTVEGTSSFRAKLESRKKLRTDRLVSLSTKTRKKEVSISAILSQTTIDERESDDDGDAVRKNRSVINGAAPVDNRDSADTPHRAEGDNWPEGGTILATAAPDSDQAKKHFKENISPIEEEGAASVKDLDLGYLLNWDPSKRESKKKVTIVDDGSRGDGKKWTAPKITRNDLGYMMNWEPSPFPKRQEGDSSCGTEAGSSKHATRSRLAPQNMTRIDEEATDASFTAGGDNGMTAHSGSSQGSRNSLRQQSRASLETIASSKSHSGEYPEKSTTTAPDLPHVEKSFLPLIEKDNIITVANQPYAKLGVIGKGGSCKVYRALSRDCDVVALKKVKLDGLNKAAVDGYANEIALLKRLKGNPAIIQLYSSEVDLERKSIYLVMELGEVDLNYVLRQQELMSSQQGRGRRSALNMNFIRLTWQQMLTAVHSIHEERIVHSDLKPAVRTNVSVPSAFVLRLLYPCHYSFLLPRAPTQNFLFVRGALKLIDFGIAKAIESQDTTNVYRETLSGTLSYMSPEAIMDTTTNSNGVRVNKCGRVSHGLLCTSSIVCFILSQHFRIPLSKGFGHLVSRM